MTKDNLLVVTGGNRGIGGKLAMYAGEEGRL